MLPRSPVWNVIQESTKIATSSYHTSTNIARKALKFRPAVQNNFGPSEFFFQHLKHRRKEVIEGGWTVVSCVYFQIVMSKQ